MSGRSSSGAGRQRKLPQLDVRPAYGHQGLQPADTAGRQRRGNPLARVDRGRGVAGLTGSQRDQERVLDRHFVAAQTGHGDPGLGVVPFKGENSCHAVALVRWFLAKRLE